MNDLDLLDVAVFVRAARLGNLSGAGREFALSPAATSARLAQLERTLGTRLLHRTTRRISLTQEGESFLAHAQQLLDCAAAAQASVGHAQGSPQGRLRVSIPSSFGRQHVSPVLSAFLTRYPGISLELRLSDRLIDIVEEGIDLAIRIGALKSSTLVARKLVPNRRVVCCAPAYLERRGIPRHPADLGEHECLILSGQSDWPFETPTGTLNVRVSGRLVTDNGEIIRDAALAGFGVALKSTWDVAPHLRAGRLVTLLDNYPVAGPSAIWAVYPSRAFVPPKTHAFIDFLQHHFGAKPYWDVGDDDEGTPARAGAA